MISKRKEERNRKNKYTNLKCNRHIEKYKLIIPENITCRNRLFGTGIMLQNDTKGVMRFYLISNIDCVP